MNLSDIGQTFPEMLHEDVSCCWRQKFVIKTFLRKTQDLYVIDVDKELNKHTKKALLLFRCNNGYSNVQLR